MAGNLVDDDDTPPRNSDRGALATFACRASTAIDFSSVSSSSSSESDELAADSMPEEPVPGSAEFSAAFSSARAKSRKARRSSSTSTAPDRSRSNRANSAAASASPSASPVGESQRSQRE